ncbi:MAG: hypothetical protein OHK006_13120 [Thermodesulfovibrionales bacterium]
MKDWIAIFRTGRHTDSAGNKKDWTEQDLDRIVETYDPTQHEAPVVIGHPETNAPAWGWVEALKREGDTLYMRMRDVVPAFAEMLRQKLFKKRSVSLYPDGSLRHVGWLGAQPPAVKGLPDFAFGDTAGMSIDFDESAFALKPRKEEFSMGFWERLKKRLAESGVSFRELFGSDEPPTLYTEQDVAARIEDEVRRKVQAKEAEFAEAAKRKDEELWAREAALAKKESDARKASIGAFCEDLKKKGILTPAMEKMGMGFTQFMQAIAGIETPIEFGEGDGKGRQTPLEFMQKFLGALPPQIEFQEVAGKDKDTKTGSAAERIEALVRQKMKADKVLTYGAAFAEVQKENPELADEYAEELEK